MNDEPGAIRRTCVVRLPLGTRLRQCRLFAGLTQTALAGRTGIPGNKISSLESGRQRGYLDEIRTIVWFTGCGDQEQEILQCWRDFKKPKTDRQQRQQEAIDYEVDPEATS